MRFSKGVPLKVILIGGGGHAKVVIDAIKRSDIFSVSGILDPAFKKGESVLSVPIAGSDSDLPEIFKKGIRAAFISVGSIGNCDVRKRIYENLKRIGFKLPVITHPNAIVAEGVEIGEGTFIAAGVVINSGTKIGVNAIINTVSSVDHDCQIGDFVHIAPRATLSGDIEVGDETHIGTGANIIHSLRIGKRCMIGAGATITRDIADDARIYDNRRVSYMQRNKHVFIIAEAGVNHNGDLEIAKRLIDAASEAGADAVKFQTFDPNSLASRYAPKADYQRRLTNARESHLDMLKRLALDPATHRRLISHCNKKGITFLSSPFDLKSIELLRRLGLSIFKIPSGEITNLLYLRCIGRLGKKVILSTGMSNLKEIGSALEILIDAGTKKQNITALHCNTSYPTPFRDVNLRAMLTIRDTFGIGVGYSDHTIGIEAAIAAVALGASVIEKHLTLDVRMDGPDHKASIMPGQFKDMVKAIRNIEKSIGSGIKRSSESEAKNLAIVRKSIVAARDIRKGHILSEDDMAIKRIKRPASSISPMEWDCLLGKPAKKDFKKDEAIEL